MDKYGRIAADLAAQGWSVCQDFLAADAVNAMRSDVQQHWQDGAFRRAAIGRGETMQVHGGVRGDHIAWLDGVSAAQQAFLDEMESLRLALNRALFLGLFEYEGHLTFYPPGAFYGRHLDRHRDTDSRMVSCVAYLNEGWQADDGGELRLFASEGSEERSIIVAPRAGSFVCFLSASIYHEVLPTHVPRYSIAGWFRRRESP